MNGLASPRRGQMPRIRKPRRDECPPTPLAIERLCIALHAALEAAKDWERDGHGGLCHCGFCIDARGASYFLTMALSSLEGNMITTRAMASAQLANADWYLTPQEQVQESRMFRRRVSELPDERNPEYEHARRTLKDEIHRQIIAKRSTGDAKGELHERRA